MTNEELNNEEGLAPEEMMADALATAEDETFHLNGDGVVVEEADSTAEVVIESAEETIARLEGELAAAQAQANEAIDRMQRTAAEFQNTRKRQERLLQESLERATQRLLTALLPVQDDFSLAFQNLPGGLSQEDTAWVDGFKRIRDKLGTILNDEGVTEIEATGPFDPNRHEAVTNEPNDEVESGHIIATLRTGYLLKERVLRPALVRVAQ
ncbi:MAG: nucleotide exchange factor GrpE [Caldilineaceae bacterium]|nr:nucleotide exchange factor GrpE [Caldilineaceae bacterium]HRJ41092.1 nucleotide exchange factor GrpE [Caldilineaceae bacterium]